MYTIVHNSWGEFDVYFQAPAARFPAIVNVGSSFGSHSEAVTFLTERLEQAIALTGVTTKEFAKI